jgi:hypothetical protein
MESFSKTEITSTKAFPTPRTVGMLCFVIIHFLWFANIGIFIGNKIWLKKKVHTPGFYCSKACRIAKNLLNIFYLTCIGLLKSMNYHNQLEEGQGENGNNDEL